MNGSDRRFVLRQAKRRQPTACPRFVQPLVEIPFRQQQAQRSLLDRLGVKYGIEKPSKKLLPLTERNGEVSARIRKVVGR